MTDKDLILAFRPIIIAGLASLGYPNVEVVQNHQPTIQGTPSGPTVFFHKVADKRYGFVQRYDTDTLVPGEILHTEIQKYETTFQISALVTIDPNATPDFTASDLVNSVAMIMSSDNTREILLAVGIGLLRIKDVRNPYFKDDREQFEASPSFDFILTYDRSIQYTIPDIESVNSGIYGF